MKIKKKIAPISIVIPTIGRKSLINSIYSICKGSILPKEVLIVTPKSELDKFKIPKIFSKIKIKKIFTSKKNQVFQRIYGFKLSKNPFVLQLDDDVVLKKNCLEKLYNFSKKNSKTAVAPKYKSTLKISKIYRKPNSVFLKFYHWIINGKDGYSPGKIALSGFNYADEKHNNGFGQHEWLSGGAILHQKKNIIFKNYYFFNYSKCFCEDILHSLKLSEKSIKLIKLYSAVAIAKESGSIVKRRSLTTTLINFLSELNVRFYIVKNYNKSYIRFVLYYFILMLRIILKMLFGKR